MMCYPSLLVELEYLAPEMILNNGVDYTADVWALGIIAYEMVMYATPFADRDGMKVFSNIAACMVGSIAAVLFFCSEFKLPHFVPIFFT